jgi:hypothetical protein
MNHTKHNIELRLKSSNTNYMQQYIGIIRNINNIVMEYIISILGHINHLQKTQIMINTSVKIGQDDSTSFWQT